VKVGEHIHEVEQFIVNSPIILSFQIKERWVRRFDAYIKVRVTLIVTPSGQLLLRWDNVGHYPHLAGFPHHLHEHDEKHVISSEPMTLFKALEQIGKTIPLMRNPTTR
jgi:hypothetical protein